jgi:hypothetical protein
MHMAAGICGGPFRDRFAPFECWGFYQGDGPQGGTLRSASVDGQQSVTVAV